MRCATGQSGVHARSAASTAGLTRVHTAGGAQLNAATRWYFRDQRDSHEDAVTLAGLAAPLLPRKSRRSWRRPVNEAYRASETTESASERAAAAPCDASSGSASADSPGGDPDAASADLAGYSDSDIDAVLDAEEQLPESRTRQEAALATWDHTPDDPADSDLASEYDGDVAALLAEEQRLPEPRARQEAAAATWDDTTQPGDDDPGSFSGDPASEYDGDVAALLAAEDQLPEPRSRQEAAADTWDDTNSSQDGAPDTSTDGASPSQPDASIEPSALNHEDEDGAPDPYEHQVDVHTMDGTDVAVTVEDLPPEARTVGDTTPTGVGRKPTGAEILGMEGDDRTDSRLGRLFDEMFKEADNVSDGSGAIGEAIVIDDRSANGPSGHSQPYHATTSNSPDHPIPLDPGASDAISSMTIIGVAAAVAIRHALSALRKEHKA
jgi:hypothetical protein